MIMEFQLPEQPNVVWSPSAIRSLVGQRTTFEGAPADIVEARRDDRGRVYVTLRFQR